MTRMGIEYEKHSNSLVTQRDQQDKERQEWKKEGLDKIKRIIAETQKVFPEIAVDPFGNLFSRKKHLALALDSLSSEQIEWVEKQARKVMGLMDEYGWEQLPEEMVSPEAKN